MKYITLITCLLCSSLFAKETLKVTIEKVKQTKEYNEVSISELEVIPQQKSEISAVPKKQPKNNKVDKINANAALAKLQALIPKLTNAPIPKLKIEPYSLAPGLLLSGNNKHCRIYAAFDEKNELTYFSLSQNTSPLEGNTKTTKESFQTYATKLYEVVLGQAPLGEVSFRHDGDGLASAFKEEGVFWRQTVKGVQFPDFGRASLAEDTREGYFRWQLNVSMGCTKADEKEIKDYLAKHPLNLTENEAYAIALKAIEKLDIKLKPERTWFRASNMKHELSPSVPAPSHIPGAGVRQWKAKGDQTTNRNKLHYCTKVTIAEGLFLNECFIDFTTKKIIHINSYKQSW
eukprot:Seg14657.1 transcript_id=Seg14657.1/GoldUCD/mRNA.D3Y31 product="hypothetical protein" protein_id=Seg14657.1/GoldUCD/D3Y31